MLSFFGKLIMWSGEIKGRILTGEVRAWGHISLISSQLHLPKGGGRESLFSLDWKCHAFMPDGYILSARLILLRT